jgi:hypothetical protein
MENNFFRPINIKEDWVSKFSPYVNWATIITDKKKPPYEKIFRDKDILKELIPDYVHTRLNDVGIQIRVARIFSWPHDLVNDHNCLWHVDGVKFIEKTTVNFLLFGGGKIQWAGDNVAMPRTTAYSSRWEATKASPDDQILFETSVIPALYNIEPLHRVVTPPEGRVTLSLLWEEKCIRPFPEMVQRFTDAGFIDPG